MESKIGFFIWNPFQYFQIRSIAENLPNAELLINKRSNIDFDRVFNKQLLSSMKTPVQLISQNYFIDDCPDHSAIIAQSPFTYMEYLENTKLIGMQYSMAKERHQYGPWRAMCDLNLVYGSYSDGKISPFSPCVQVGNPRFDNWFAQEQQNVDIEQLEPEKRTVLYLPTWSNTSSISTFNNAVQSLSKTYNIIVKMHHLTDIFEKKKRQLLTSSKQVHSFGAGDDLLELMEQADVVLSDYSGAIFDAINVGKPVILLQSKADKLDQTDRFGYESIEYKRRDEIGIVVDDPNNLASAIAQIVTNKVDFTQTNKTLQSECFAHQKNCGKRAADEIQQFLERPIKRDFYQIYLRDQLRQSRKQFDPIHKSSVLSKPLNWFKNVFLR